MAFIQREIAIAAPLAHVWDALRDVGAIHLRLAPGFVVDVKLEPGARIVTFGDGTTVRELIVDVDDTAHRVAWSVVGSSMTHHNASAQVFTEGDGRCRFVWIADLLPNEAAPRVTAMIERGLAVMKETLERSALVAPVTTLPTNTER